MSKAGLYGHFGSKERLQLETVALGREIFQQHVIAPAQQAPPGLPRLWALCKTYLGYVAASIFPGGDFWVMVANEYDTRPGRVRDEIAGAIAAWMQLLEDLITNAVELGHLGSCDPTQLAFEIEALLVAGNHVYHLNNDPQALSWHGQASPGGWRTCAHLGRRRLPSRASPPRRATDPPPRSGSGCRGNVDPG